MPLRVATAGESHGPAVLAVVEGIPAGLRVPSEAVDAVLARRQGGYGRGARMRIERDRVEFLAGLRGGITLGDPVVLVVRNRDSSLEQLPAVTRPRPGHADLAGMLKMGTRDARDVLERASARSTAALCAAGAVAALLLREFGIEAVGFCRSIGGVEAGRIPSGLRALRAARDRSPFLCPDPSVTGAMTAQVDAARMAGDTVGGVVEVRAEGVPPGLGDFRTAEARLDGRLAAALMRIPAIKGVEIGLGFEGARRFGFETHDEIFYQDGRFVRRTNRAGGLEGGMSNGEPIVIRGAMKPISTQYAPMASVDLLTKEPFKASVERSDICSVPAAGVIGEAVVAFEIARAFREKFGGDSLDEMTRNYRGYLTSIRDR